LSAANCAAGTASYDSKPWLEDLEQTREALSTKYANLEWVVIEREVDLESLFTDAKAQLQSAKSETDARAIFDRLARRLGDGHVRFRWSVDPVTNAVPNANCAALGYDSQIRGRDVAAFMPGYAPIVDPPATEFPAGTIQVPGHRVGVLKVGIFTPQGMPELCAEALVALNFSPDTPCDDACKDLVDTWVSDRMTRDLAAQLRAIKNAKADVLLVDVANNGGGTEWAEAVARMVTGMRLRRCSMALRNRCKATSVRRKRHAIPLLCGKENARHVTGLGWVSTHRESSLRLIRTPSGTNHGQPMSSRPFNIPTKKGSGAGRSSYWSMEGPELPDCARMRADGTNEVMGIQPDVLVGLRTTDGPHRQGIRVANCRKR
jgi:hypothetical protein